MLETLGYDFAGLRKQTAYYLGYGRDEAKWGSLQLAELAEMVNSGYSKLLSVHGWRCKRPTMSLSLLASVTGTLASVPDRFGRQHLVVATDSVFASGNEGDPLTFDESGHEFTISEYLDAMRVKVVGEKDVEFGEYATGTVAEVIGDTAYTEITAKAALFEEGMVGDSYVGPTPSFNTYVIQDVVSSTVAHVEGDASGETDNDIFTVERAAVHDEDETLAYDGTNTTVTATNAVFREDMETDSDTLAFDSGSSYSIAEYLDDDTVKVTGDASGETAGDTLTIKKAGELSSAAADTTSSTIRSTKEIFEPSMVGMYVAFEQDPSDIAKDFEILAVLDADLVQVNGDAGHNMPSTAFGVVHRAGQVTAANEPEITVDLQTPIFVAGHVGKTLLFRRSGNKYSITGHTDSTHVNVTGAPSNELTDPPDTDQVWVVGPAAQAAGDEFSVGNAGHQYELPISVGGVEGDITYSSEYTWPAIRIIGETQLRKMRQHGSATGRPQYAALSPVYQESQAPPRYRIEFYPTPDGSYTVEYRARLQPVPLSEKYPYPVFPASFGPLLLESCLSVAELRMNDEKGIHAAEYERLLFDAVKEDKRDMQPETLGQIIDPSVSRRRRPAADRQCLGQVTVRGVLYD